jgi:hypothetical protein
MQLSKRATNEFKQIYLQVHGIQLSDKEVKKKSHQLLKIGQLIMKRIPKEIFKNVQ